MSAKLFIENSVNIENPDQLTTILTGLMPSIEAFWPDNDKTSQFWFEWGNEAPGHVTVARYDENDVLKTLGERQKSLVKAWELPFINPYN